MIQSEPQDTKEKLASEWLKRGIEYFEKGNYNAALDGFEKALALNPQNFDAWYERGVSLDQLNRYEDAIASYDKALDIEPDDHYAWYCRGNALRDLDRYEEAIASYEQALKIKPDFPEAWTNRGFVLSKLQRYEEAISCCDEALKINPDFPEAWIAWLGRGNALNDWQRYEEALASYDKAIDIKPDYYEAWYNRGNTLCILERYEEAIASCEKTLALTPNYYEAWYSRGIALDKLERYEEAIASYDQALQLRRDLSAVWLLRGNALSQLQQYQEAIASYDQALEFEPGCYLFWYRRSNALSELHRYEEALNSYDKALEIQPDYQDAWFERGVVLGNLRRYEEAIASYDKALEIQPEEYTTWYNRGIALEKLDCYEEALLSYDQALKIKPDMPQAWTNRGNTLDKLQRYEEAVSSFDQALKIEPDFPEAWIAWYSRGDVLADLQQYEAAIISYNKALQLQPDKHRIWFSRGIALYKLYRHEEAIASYDQALNIKLNDWKTWINRGIAAGDSVNCEPVFASFSPIAKLNPILNQRGYRGRLATHEEGLKYVHQDIQPEGWGQLHQFIGNAHYFRGRVDSRPFPYWRKAVNSYNEALKTLTESTFPELHLEVLQDLIKTKLALGQKAEAEELQRRGSDLLRRLLADQNHSDSSKKQLALKFVAFNQLTVDLAMQSGQLVKALEVAEEGKNACLTWLLYGWNDEIPKPNWDDIKQLVNPTTAVVYWHLSPAALTTFILKHDAPSPIVIGLDPPNPPSKGGLEETKSSFPPYKQRLEKSFLPFEQRLEKTFPPFEGGLGGIVTPQEIPESLQRLQEFEDWVKDWNEQYIDYRSKAKDKQSRINHSWRMSMEQRLEKLKNLLNIPAIEQELKGITQLILIPHRDLHRFPLHAFFNLPSISMEEGHEERGNFTMTYLPSAQIGINLQQRQPNPTQHLLSVEHPTSRGFDSLKFAQIESEAISQIFNKPNKPTRIQSERASKKQVEEALSDEYTVFHFAGHGTHNFNNPKKSELSLADEDKLTLEEICQKNLTNYNLVTLSACETAITGNQTITTEYVGLVSGFLSQGVAHVVSTLWTVESAATALVMIDFYRRRRAGKSEAAALAEATQWLKELTVQQLKEWYEAFLIQLPPDELRIKAFIETEVYRLGRMEPDKKLYPHPYYWAAFTITGKPY